jgi:hypothetical protein
LQLKWTGWSPVLKIIQQSFYLPLQSLRPEIAELFWIRETFDESKWKHLFLFTWLGSVQLQKLHSGFSLHQLWQSKKLGMFLISFFSSLWNSSWKRRQLDLSTKINYSQTCVQRLPLGLKKMAVVQRWLLFTVSSCKLAISFGNWGLSWSL